MSTVSPLMSGQSATRVNLVTLGCARNEVDSSEIAGRLTAGGYELVADPAEADVVVVNTCAFVASAKKDSIDTVLAAADTGAKVVAVGCLAERYGDELAAALPEADAVLGFDAYPDLAALLGDVVDGHRPAAHTPVDRRLLLPISPTSRPAAAAAVSLPGARARFRSDAGPHAAAIRPGRPSEDRLRLRSALHVLRHPFFPGRLRLPADRRTIVTEARWLAEQGIREIVLVSENSTSYGKDLPGERQLETLLTALGDIPGIGRVRLSYLQPAETRPWLIEAIAGTSNVADYYDMSFQHASEPVLRRMRRYGSRASFLALIDQIRAAAPEAGIRSNVIVGFPGETEADLAELEAFLIGARMDAVGVFGYSDEDGTAAAELPDKLDDDVIAERVERVTSLVEELTAQRAEDRIGTDILVLVDDDDAADDAAAAQSDAVRMGRGAHQAPEVDGNVAIHGSAAVPLAGLRPGDLVWCRVTGSEGIDLLATAMEVTRPYGVGGTVLPGPDPVAGRA